MSSSVMESAFPRKNSSWDWNNPEQSDDFVTEAQTEVFTYFLCNDSEWRRASGIPLGLYYIGSVIVKQICLIGEQILKSLGQLFGALDPSSDLTALKGLEFLGRACANVLLLAVSIPEVLFIGFIAIPIVTAAYPEDVVPLFIEPKAVVETSEIYGDNGYFNELLDTP